MHHTVWIIDAALTVVPGESGSALPLPDGTLDNAGTMVNRLVTYLARNGDTEGTVLLTDQAAEKIGWLEPVTEQGFQPARAELERRKYQVFGSGDWATCKSGTRPQLHIGLIDELDRKGWTFEHAWWYVTVNAMQEWHRRSGHAWANNHPIMGVELIHRTIRPWRVPGVTGNRQVVKKDLRTPPGAVESPFTPQNWRNPQPKYFYRHQYDRHRAGLTAAGAAKLPAEELQNGWRKFDGKRAGWWSIEIPAWNMKELPHPAGPHKVGSIQWVTTATMDLLAEMAHQGLVSMPDVRESWTAPARPILQPFQKLLEHVYQTGGHPLVKDAAKEVGTAGIGMLGNPDGSFYNLAMYHAVNATKRANMWRTAWRVGNACGRYPIAFDDDAMWYGSDVSDPVACVPNGVTLADTPGGFHADKTVEQQRKKASR